MAAIADVLTDLFRSLMFFLDGIVYGFIPTLYGLISYIAQVDIFSSDPNIQKLMSQIYSLLSIFMLFKLSFSFLQYIINPDSLTDESKGIGKIVTHVLVVVILLVTVPYIFNIGYKLQAAIVQSNIIGELLLGSSFSNGTDQRDVGLILQEFFDLPDPNAPEQEQMETSDTSNKLETNAKDLQFLIFGAFYSINTEKLTECEGTPIIGSNEMGQNEACITKLAEEFDSNDDLINNNANLANYFRTSGDESGDNRKFEELGDILNWRIDNVYVVNYLPFISTVAGIYLVFLLITICIDIAMRAIKLCFLQMIAPISIVSYVDPKESSGDSKLRRWASEAGKTYAMLFIRLATVFLVIRFVSIIASSVFERDFLSAIDSDYKMWIFVFLILGAFVFAKQVPKLLENLLNIKSSGEFSLNPIKNITSNVGASAAIGGAVGLAGGFAANAGNIVGKGLKAHGTEGGFRKEFLGVKKGEFSAASGFGKAKIVGVGAKNLFGNTLGTLAGGAAAGAFHTGKATAGGKIPEGIKTGHDKVITNREQRDAKQQQPVTTRIQNAATQFAGIKNEFGGVGAADKQIKGLQEQLQQNAQIQNQLREQFAETITKKGINYSSVNNINQGVFNYESYKQAVEKTGATAVSKSDYNKMSYYDRYVAVQQDTPDSPKLNLTTTREKQDFNELMAIQGNIQATTDNEKRIKKEISDAQRAAGLGNKNDKPKLGE